MLRRALIPAALAALITLGVSASPAAAAPLTQICVRNRPVSKLYPCPSGWDVETTIGDAVSKIASNGTIQIEPDTYSETVSANSASPTGVTFTGDPGVSARPIITAGGGDSTLDLADGDAATHLDLRYTGTADFAAVDAVGSATLTDLALTSTAGCAYLSGTGAVDRVTASTSAAVNCMDFEGTVGTNTLTNSSVVGGTSGVYEDGSLQLSHDSITGIAGNALYADHVTADHSTFSAHNGAAIQMLHTQGPTDLTLTDSLVTSSGSSTLAGGIALEPASTVTLRNDTVVSAGDAVEVPSASGQLAAANAAITNSILRGATDLDLEPTSTDCTIDGTTSSPCAPAHATVDHSDLRTATGFTDGGGNISADPQFANGTIGSGQDFHLGVFSPAIAAGAAVPAGDEDLDGTPWDSFDQAPAMGAYDHIQKRSPNTPTPTPTPTPADTPVPALTPTALDSATTAPLTPSAPLGPPAPGPTPTPLPSNAFSLVGKPKVANDGTITIVEKPVSAGVFTVAATLPVPAPAKSSKGASKAKPKPAPAFGTTTGKSSASQPSALVLKPSKAARAAIRVLKHGKTLTVTVKVGFTPTGGAAATAALTVKIAAPATPKR